MNTTVTLDKAGRVVIPRSLRKELNLEPGDSMELGLACESITLRPIRSALAPWGAGNPARSRLFRRLFPGSHEEVK